MQTEVQLVNCERGAGLE